jgi:hypothetical protein
MARVGQASGAVASLSGALIVTLYVVFSMGDMALSSIAFSLGVGEANPLLAWLAAHSMFVPAKIGLTALVAGLMHWFYPRPYGRGLACFVVVLMLGLLIYHYWGLCMMGAA